MHTREELYSKYGTLQKFDQREFIYGKYETCGMGSEGYVYIPHECQNDAVKLTSDKHAEAKPCKLHVVLHGAM